MERLAPMWSYAPYIAAIVVLAVIVFVIVLVVRSHRLVPPRVRVPSQPEMSAEEADDDLLDSSHIGFAPLVGSVSLPSRKHGKNGA